MCAAAVVAVGVGSSADAATVVHKVNIKLIYAEEQIWSDDISEIIGRNVYEEYWTIPTGQTRRGAISVEELPTGQVRAIVTVGSNIVADLVGEGSVNSIDIFFDRSGGGYDWTALTWENGAGALEKSYDYTFRTFGARANIVSPPPVPLPAAGALLPLGIGALAAMRKRRRSI